MEYNLPTKRNYLVLVKYSLSGHRLYYISTNNIYRVIGKFYYGAMGEGEKVDKLDIFEYDILTLKLFERRGYKPISINERRGYYEKREN